jgi:hypothetical protein
MVGPQEPTMRFMILVKATADSEAGAMPTQALFDAMGAFHEELARAGVLLDASGLKPTAAGFRVVSDGQKRRVVDGPFTETKELVAGYTMIQVRSRDEALEWARRFPNPSLDGGAAEIEVRPLYELDDFAALCGSAAVEVFRDLEVQRR